MKFVAYMYVVHNLWSTSFTSLNFTKCGLMLHSHQAPTSVLSSMGVCVPTRCMKLSCPWAVDGDILWRTDIDIDWVDAWTAIFCEGQISISIELSLEAPRVWFRSLGCLIDKEPRLVIRIGSWSLKNLPKEKLLLDHSTCRKRVPIVRKVKFNLQLDCIVFILLHYSCDITYHSRSLREHRWTQSSKLCIGKVVAG
jgi:hypothetical protein